MNAPAANSARGEVALSLGEDELVLRPSFAALVAAEDELGPLFELVERAAAGKLRMVELATLFWHCLATDEDIAREEFFEALADAGLAALTPALGKLLRQILQGR